MWPISASQSALGVLDTADGTSTHFTANACSEEGMEVKQSISVFSPLLLYIYIYICTAFPYQKKLRRHPSYLSQQTQNKHGERKPQATFFEHLWVGKVNDDLGREISLLQGSEKFRCSRVGKEPCMYKL